MRKNSIKDFFRGIALLFFLLPIFVSAQSDRQYWYDSIRADISVHQDSTFTVRETLTYHFVGTYHKGYRKIPFNKISTITDVNLFDAVTGQKLTYTSSVLNKDSSLSWGYYTYHRSNGAMNIEWYYDASDTVRSWVIEYTVHGGISFLKDKDELYWNLFTDYEVPIVNAQVTVTIPGNTYLPTDHQAQIYVAGAVNPKYAVANNQTFVFSADNILPYGDVTIAAGWPKGIVDRSAFWKDFLFIHLSSILIFLTIFLTLITMLLYWYFSERYNTGRGTIIPQYEPPQRLRPAMAEVIVKEKISPKGWAATVVDLAVRGYVSIKEEAPPVWSKIFSYTSFVIILILLLLLSRIFMNGFRYISVKSIFDGAIVILLLGLFAYRIWGRKVKGGSFVPKDYVVERVKNYHGDLQLEAYERKFLGNILIKGRFSTREMRKNPAESRALYHEMRALEKELYKETEIDTNAFEKPISKQGILGFSTVCIGGAVAIAVMSLGTPSPIPSPLDFLAVLILCAVALFLFIKYEAKLSQAGEILKEEWLGFKLYLETAEKYRMQNLTPETFEKYLPYAIVFGVEKKWGKAFESLKMQPPTWYASGVIASGNPGSFPSGSFSASAFSASFGSSFTSAFSSSGGGGASGGGGGAGGGGGGGGGGAS